jgi:superfamily II DNA or RNA helicase
MDDGWTEQHGWAEQLSDGAIRGAVGVDAYLRGAAYARDGRVEQLTEGGGRTLLATVRGTRGSYSTLVVAESRSAPGTRRWSGQCTCPVPVNCKHVAAVLVAARARLATPEKGLAETQAWEGPIAEIVQTVVDEDHGDQVDHGVPLALQLEVVTSNAAVARLYGRTAPPAVQQQRILARPVTRGKSGKWVRTGVSWRELELDYGYYAGPSPVRRHREALRELYGVFQARGRTSSSYYYSSSDRPLYLDELGTSLWRLLELLTDAGVQLVPSKGSGGPVQVSTQPASVSLDMRRATPEDGATLDAVVTLDGAALHVASVRLLGNPAHGIFVDGFDGGGREASPSTGGLLLAPLDRPPGEQVSRLLQDGRRIEIPAADLDRFMSSYLPALRQAVTVASSDETVTLPEVEPPRLALTVTYGAAHSMALDWAFAYATDSDVVRVPLRGPAGTLGVRDRRAEQALLDGLDLPAGRLPQLRTDVAGRLLLAPHVQLSDLDTVTFTQDVLPALQERDDVLVEIVGTPADYRHTHTAPLIRVSATDSSGDADWYDLGVTVSVDGEEIPFDVLFVALARGDTHLLLDSGTYFGIERPELEQLRRLIEEARGLQDRESGGMRISTYQAGLWEELTELGIVATQSERWARTVKGLLNVDQLAPPRVPDGLDAQLRPYQVDGYQWLSFLHDHELGGILADDMGLGKTVQTLAMICRAVEQAETTTAPFLVIAPTSVVPNWWHEAARFAPGLTVATISETESKQATPLSAQVAGANVVVTSYALFRIDYEAYAAQPWSGLILDEAQFVKNHQAKTYQCARRLPAPFKLAITGTPLENNLMELWSLLSIVAPGLFPSPQRFSELYAKPIERGGDAERLATFRQRIRPLMRRRTKEQVVAELPPKQEQVLEVALNERHQRIYQTHLQRERQKVLGLIDDLDKNRFAIFRSLTLLRQLSLDPALVDDKYAGVRSSKVDAFLEQLDEVVSEGHRALVFSQFTGFLRTVRERLDAENVAYCYLDGRTRDRAKRIDEFKNGDAPVFLISLKAGGFGLNLTEADYVFVLDPWWNPAVEAQAVDRTHRIGQDKTVMVYRLVATDTIEEKVMELKARKMGLFSRVMDDDALLSAPLSADDIKGLLG